MGALCGSPDAPRPQQSRKQFRFQSNAHIPVCRVVRQAISHLAPAGNPKQTHAVAEFCALPKRSQLSRIHQEQEEQPSLFWMTTPTRRMHQEACALGIASH